MFFNTEMFLVMDQKELPDHIKKTFKLVPTLHGGWSSELAGLHVVDTGEEIGLTAYSYVVVYASNDWHYKEAESLLNQIKNLRADAPLIALPVEVEVRDEDPFQGIVMSRSFSLPKP